MGADTAISVLTTMLWNAFIVGGPILIATLIVGLMVSVFQVTTQIQEITLSYVPKILSAGLLLIVLGPWMLGRIAAFAMSLYRMIPDLGG